MQTLKSKREVLELLTSVLDTSDAVAQMLLLRILGALAPVLSGLLDIQHKVLLAVDSKFRCVRDMALKVLPALLPSAPSLARHVFRKELDPEVLVRLCTTCPDDEEAVTRAFTMCQKQLTGELLAQGAVALAVRSSTVLVRAVRSSLERSPEGVEGGGSAGVLAETVSTIWLSGSANRGRDC